MNKITSSKNTLTEILTKKVPIFFNLLKKSRTIFSFFILYDNRIIKFDEKITVFFGLFGKQKKMFKMNIFFCSL